MQQEGTPIARPPGSVQARRTPCRWVAVASLVALMPWTVLGAARPQQSLGAGLVVREREVVRSVNDCDPVALGCSAVVLRYPEIVEAPTAWALEGLPQVIAALLSPSIFGDPDAPPQDLEAMFAQFVAEERAFRKELPEFEMSWSLERTVRVVHVDARVVSLMLDEYSYLGGAHPNTTRTYRSYDLDSGVVISLNALFSPAALAELESLAEADFRRARGIPPGASLDEEGFWFDGGRFALNDNWAIVDRGLLFYYNPYEVAAYAAGPTEVRIPASDASRLALPGSPLETDS